MFPDNIAKQQISVGLKVTLVIPLFPAWPPTPLSLLVLLGLFLMLA